MAVPIIGQSNTHESGSRDVPSIEDMDEETKARLAAMGEEHPEDVDDSMDVQTAFFVVQHTDGTWQVVPDVTARFAPDRLATPHDIIGGCSVVATDVQISTVARATVGMMMQATQQMGQRMQEQQVLQQMAGKNLRG